MRVPLSWLQDYVEITLPVEELAEKLTIGGREVAAIEYVGIPGGNDPDHLVWDRNLVVVGQILEVSQHPDADRLVLAKANGAHTTLDTIEGWIDDVILTGARHVVVVVDYLQKIAINREHYDSEDEVITYLTHGLKDIALAKGIHVIAIAASDRLGLRAQRMRLSDMRGSSAIQYEADIGLMLNNKYDVVSRQHLIYNLAQGEAMRGWVVMSVEKNRAGRHAVDMEFALDAAHFRILPQGDFIRERLVDEKAVKE